MRNPRILAPMCDLLHWTTYLGAALALAVTPGPSRAFILGHTLHRGRRAGLTAAAGT